MGQVLRGKNPSDVVVGHGVGYHNSFRERARVREYWGAARFLLAGPIGTHHHPPHLCYRIHDINVFSIVIFNHSLIRYLHRSSNISPWLVHIGLCSAEMPRPGFSPKLLELCGIPPGEHKLDPMSWYGHLQVF
jgi:hypothetical protein